MTTSNATRLMAIGLIALGLGSPAATAQTTAASIFDVPPVPANIEAPGGHAVYLKGYAVGTQNYQCAPAGTGVAWKLLGPQATLFFTLRGEIVQQITTHFFSANPAEAGTARPTWQHSFDTSQVWGRAAAASSDPNYVEPGAIPWLLLEIVGSRRGPTGGRLLSQTTYIQRLNTSGGVAPAAGCTEASELGAVALVPYTTDYYFYKATRR